ncbi:MAG: CDP-glycerol glycerophosphotransferase family protein, partial [Actinomycetes bacterium]
PLMRSSKEIVDAIADVDRLTAAQRDRYTRFQEMFTHLEDGGATQRVLDLLFPSGVPVAGGPTNHPTTLEGDENRADH